MDLFCKTTVPSSSIESYKYPGSARDLAVSLNSSLITTMSFLLLCVGFSDLAAVWSWPTVGLKNFESAISVQISSHQNISKYHARHPRTRSGNFLSAASKVATFRMTCHTHFITLWYGWHVAILHRMVLEVMPTLQIFSNVPHQTVLCVFEVHWVGGAEHQSSLPNVHS